MDLGLNNAEKFERVREKFKGRTIVLFDDASYSGKQMTSHLYNVRRIVEHYSLEARDVVVVVPFITPNPFQDIVWVLLKVNLLDSLFLISLSINH